MLIAYIYQLNYHILINYSIYKYTENSNQIFLHFYLICGRRDWELEESDESHQWQQNVRERRHADCCERAVMLVRLAGKSSGQASKRWSQFAQSLVVQIDIQSTEQPKRVKRVWISS